MNKPTLTVFTCTYNRAHTICRTYYSLCRQTCMDFEWLVIDDGSTDNTESVVSDWIDKTYLFKIRYVWKNNGGLHTGYNKAIELIDTELCVCIDSDDWMPNDAVKRIVDFWREKGSCSYAGIVGLDCFKDGSPIGGYFPNKLKESYIVNLNKWHKGDVKMIHRTELLKKVAPMMSFPGERFFNPIYLFIKVDMMLPMLVANQIFCVVDYQDANNSMSRNILYQYVQSPNSFKQLRLLHMGNRKESYISRLRHTIHYVSCCILTKDSAWLRKSPMRFSTLMVSPLGILLFFYIKRKTSNNFTLYR